jgi:hypothetical protein
MRQYQMVFTHNDKIIGKLSIYLKDPVHTNLIHFNCHDHFMIGMVWDNRYESQIQRNFYY